MTTDKNPYATPEESAAVISTRQLTEFEKWLEAELDKIDPHRFEQGRSDWVAMIALIERMREEMIAKPLPGADWTIDIRRRMNYGCSKRKCTCKAENAPNCLWWDEPGDVPKADQAPLGVVESAAPGAGGFHVRLCEGQSLPKVGTMVYGVRK